jgi:type 1 glutamine amidotransferase
MKTMFELYLLMGVLTCQIPSAYDHYESLGTPSEVECAKIAKAIPKQAASSQRPRKMLVYTLHVRDGKRLKGHASIPCANLALRLMGKTTGAYEVVFSEDVSLLGPERIKQFDAICFNNTAGVLFEDPVLRQSLLDFISGGGGFVGIHAAGATFVQYPKYDQWPEFGEMLGAYEDGGHPWGPDETIYLKVEDTTHPVNAAFGGRGFAIQDEVFQFRHGYSRDKLRILLSIDTAKTDCGPNRRILAERRKDMDLAISWVRSYGRGRVFYTSLGHNKDIFWNAPVLKHLLDGIQFALGDLKGSTTPSNKEGQRP